MNAVLLGLVILTAASVVVCHQLARRGGRHPVPWGTLALLIGPLAVLALLLARGRSHR